MRESSGTESPSTKHNSNRRSWRVYGEPHKKQVAYRQDPDLPLVSIVSPSLNQGQFIRDTIESVLMQDYPNMEYWVMDGGSTDRTVDILRAYESDPRFSWLSEPDHGQSDAINKGWRRCQGEILAYLNSDDIYYAGAIDTQTSYLMDHPEIDMVYGDCAFIDAHGEVLEHLYSRPFSLLELLHFNIPHQPTVFLRQQAVAKVGPLDLSYGHALDSEYWLRLHAAGHRIAYNPHLVAAYRLHGASKTGACHERAYVEWERLIKAYAPHDMYRQVMADLYLAVAIDDLRQGKTKSSLDHARRSIALRPTRRLALYLATLLDSIVGSSIYDNLVRFHTKQLSRSRSQMED